MSDITWAHVQTHNHPYTCLFIAVFVRIQKLLRGSVGRDNKSQLVRRVVRPRPGRLS